MAVSARVQRDRADLLDDEIAKDGAVYTIRQTRNRFSVYPLVEGYSQTSGQTLTQGLVERDPSGKPVTFSTIELAKTWIKAGMPVVDQRGDDIVWSEWEAARA